MESISTSLVTQQLLTVASNHAQLSGLAVGQQLSGTVLTVAQQGTVTLQLNQATFTARTTLPLIAGQSLALVVEKIGPEIRLRILDQQLHPSNLVQAIRQQLPKQGSIIELLTNLHRIARQSGGTRLPGSITQLARHVVDSLTQISGSLSGESVKQAILNSGHFLEQRLLRLLSDSHRGALERDFKAGLVRLRTALADMVNPGGSRPVRSRSAPATTNQQAHGNTNTASPGDAAVVKTLNALSQQVESALARIQLHQLTSLIEVEGSRSAWNLELPVRDGDEVQMVRFRIEKRPSSRGGQGGGVFSTVVSIELPSIGAMQARLTLSGDLISVVLRAERDATVALAQSHLDGLCDRLRNIGLVPESVVCASGIHEADFPGIQQPLLDVQA